MSSKSKFIIVRHEARKAGLHYDIRFRIPGSKDWESFACRKQIPLEVGLQRMIVKTSLHTEEDALFTGTIEDGYGKGKLEKWDGGDCDIIKYTDRHIIIDFKGSKIKGIYHILSTGVMDRDYKKPTYLFFKGKIKTEVK